MGNYHQYSLKSYAKEVIIPEEHFYDENAVHCIFHYDYVERKRWEFVKDLVKVSKANPNILITIVETDEDETIMRQHQFFNGEHKSVDGKIVFPEINWFN